MNDPLLPAISPLFSDSFVSVGFLGRLGELSIVNGRFPGFQVWAFGAGWVRLCAEGRRLLKVYAAVKLPIAQIRLRIRSALMFLT